MSHGANLDPTPSQQDLREVVTRIGSLPTDQQDRIVAAAERVDDGTGLTADQWNQLIDNTR